VAWHLVRLVWVLVAVLIYKCFSLVLAVAGRPTCRRTSVVACPFNGVHMMYGKGKGMKSGAKKAMPMKKAVKKAAPKGMKKK